MLRFCLFVCVAGVTGSIFGTANAMQEDSLLVMFWNIENMFDYRDSGTGESDTEFSSFGQRRWTKGRFYTKCNAIAKTVLWIADRKGRLPDVIGLAEVENAFVVRSIVGATALRKYGYRTVHFDSPDHRGIDVALVYREDVFEKLSVRPCRIYECSPGQDKGDDSTGGLSRLAKMRKPECTVVHEGFLTKHNAEISVLSRPYVPEGRPAAEELSSERAFGIDDPDYEEPGQNADPAAEELSGHEPDVEYGEQGIRTLMGTRDILLVSFKHRISGRTYYFLVNHHPSKYGGAKASEWRRRTAMARLRFLCDSIYAENSARCQRILSGDGQHTEADSLGQRLPEQEQRREIVGIGQCLQAGQWMSDVRIIAMGDFNDTPSGGPFDILCDTVYNTAVYREKTGSLENTGQGSSSRNGSMTGCRMVNLGVPLEAAGEGTIRYGGKWELIDMFVVSAFLAGPGGSYGGGCTDASVSGQSQDAGRIPVARQGAAGIPEKPVAGKRPAARMEVVKVPFLMTRDNTHVGEKPFRTYSGPRYIGGVSDHCPIVLTF